MLTGLLHNPWHHHSQDIKVFKGGTGVYPVVTAHTHTLKGNLESLIKLKFMLFDCEKKLKTKER